MMKFSIAMAAALILSQTSAHADTYKGRIKWVDNNLQCSGPNGAPNIGDRDNAVVHLYKNVAGERFTSINVFWSYGGDGKQINADVGSVMTPVDSAASVGASTYDALDNPNAQIGFSIESKTFSNGAITMTGKIQNPWGDDTLNACIVDYLFTGLKS